jgi:large subunit ribosomal protein L24
MGKIKIKRGDTVRVITGRDKGTEAEVLRVLPSEGKVIVKGVSLRTKHQRQVQAGGRTMSPGIIQFEAPVDVSDVMLICPSCKELTRVGIRREDGEGRRFCKKCQSLID